MFMRKCDCTVQYCAECRSISEDLFGNKDVLCDMNAPFEKIADLIDRPAIKPEPAGPAYWRCPRCGAFNYKAAVTDCCGVVPAHYCGLCGSVVADD